MKKEYTKTEIKNLIKEVLVENENEKSRERVEKAILKSQRELHEKQIKEGKFIVFSLYFLLNLMVLVGLTFLVSFFIDLNYIVVGINFAISTLITLVVASFTLHIFLDTGNYVVKEKNK